jgi:hypothetical protein
MGAHQCAHLPAAGEKIGIFRSVEIQHYARRPHPALKTAAKPNCPPYRLQTFRF